MSCCVATFMQVLQYCNPRYSTNSRLRSLLRNQDGKFTKLSILVPAEFNYGPRPLVEYNICLGCTLNKVLKLMCSIKAFISHSDIIPLSCIVYYRKHKNVYPFPNNTAGMGNSLASNLPTFESSP